MYSYHLFLIYSASVRRVDSSKRPWCWESLKAGKEGDDRGWDGWMARSFQQTWVWSNSERWWRTMKPGELQSMGLPRVGDVWVTERQQVLLSTSCTLIFFFFLNPVLAFLFILVAHITHWTRSISSNSKISLEMLAYLLALPKVICLRKDFIAYYLGYYKQISARLFHYPPYSLQILHCIQIYLLNTIMSTISSVFHSDLLVFHSDISLLQSDLIHWLNQYILFLENVKWVSASGTLYFLFPFLGCSRFHIFLWMKPSCWVLP